MRSAGRLLPVLLLLFLTACMNEQSTPTPAATATRAPALTATATKAAVVTPAIITATVGATATATASSTATPAASPTQPAPGANIDIQEPKTGAKVKGPVRISGTASVFEAQLEVDVRDASGKIIATGATSASKGAPERGTYSIDLPFKVDTEQQGTIEAFSRNFRDGSVENLVKVQVTLLP